MNKKNKQRRSGSPDLHFEVGGEIAGFTAAGIAAFGDLNPEAIVREIMQNSLDAAREAGRDACIRFELKKHALDEVPGIKQYREAFDCAKQAQKRLRNGALADQAKDIVEAIETCLKSESCRTLYILDNGIGLDKARMKGILADGVSVKSENSAGAVGNGHFVVIPASDLRYVLYGGLTQQKQMIAAGHAILASHQSKDGRRVSKSKDGRRVSKSKDGYFVKRLNQDLYDPYTFLQNSEIPEYIMSKLKWIADRWQSGTVVAVPGFNDFRESKSLWDMISKAAACNFFAAFAQKELRVEFIKEEGETQVLDHTTIRATLAEYRDQRRAYSKFLSGSRAAAALDTVEKGDDVSVETEVGNVALKLRKLDDGKTSIELCRNGMWITNKLPGKLREANFASLKPFHCVVLLKAEAEDAGSIHRLVRKAEGPLHNEVSLKKLRTDERKQVYKALEAIASKVHEIIPPTSNEQYKVHHVLSISKHGIAPGGQRSSLVGKFREVPRRRSRAPTEGESQTEEGLDPDEFENQGKGNGTGSRRRRSGRGSFRRTGNALRIRGLSVPTGARSYRFDIRSEERCVGSEIRFVLDEGLDETCDDVGGEEFVRLKTVKVDGEAVSGENLIRDEKNRVLGVRLGALDRDNPLNIEIDYELPESVHVSADSPIVLKTEIIRRAGDSAK